MSSFSHSPQVCLFIDNPSWVTAAVFANLVVGQGLNFDPSCFLVIQFQSTCAVHPLCTWNWTQSRGHNQLSTGRERPTELSPGKHRLENQLFFFFYTLLVFNSLARFLEPMCYYSCLVCSINRLECSAYVAASVSFMCEQWRHGEEALGEQRGFLFGATVSPDWETWAGPGLGLLCWQSSTLCWSYRFPLVALGGTPQDAFGINNTPFSPEKQPLYLIKNKQV